MALRPTQSSGLHSSANYKTDLTHVIEELSDAFVVQPHVMHMDQLTRTHTAIHKFTPLLHNVNKDKLRVWILKTGKTILLNQ